ncbi:MAG: hypothetical protein JW761_06070, partial [Prolixibacteraceae bacterium]|nr:hypothetical protein [Prolixibacteraceae bacterium]
MNKLLKIAFLFFYSALALVIYAEQTHIAVTGYGQSDYNAERQNWSVSYAQNGEVYFANHTGLLQFDGTNWKLNNLPNETILRAVNAQADSIIYTSGYMELGFWKTDIYGQLKYTSLTPKAKKYFYNNIEFWNIVVQNNYVYFHSFSKILAYRNDSVVAIEIPGTLNVMSKVHDKVLVAVRDSGIYELKNDSYTPYIQDDVLTNKQIKFLIPFTENQLLIGTAANGIYLWNGEKLSRWNLQWTDYFIENELNRAYVTNDNKIITGTLIDGMVVFDAEGNRLMKINAENGLPNNTVLGIETDEWGNIWLALDNGIGFVSGNQNPGFVTKEIPGTGAIYSVAILNDRMYLGTNQGLFV